MRPGGGWCAVSDFDELNRWYTATGHAHASLLRWYRTVGYARHNGVSVDMREPPAMSGEDIEYLGGNTGRIDGRDMTADQVRAVQALLVQMSTEARDALAGCSTLVVAMEATR